jgi:hypothetical protein
MILMRSGLAAIVPPGKETCVGKGVVKEPSKYVQA